MRPMIKVFSLPGRLAITATALLFLAVALPSGTSAATPDTRELLGKDFRSVSTKGVPHVGARGFRIRFFGHASTSGEPKVPTLLFSAGCNANGSRFEVRRGRLFAVGGFAGTEMGCGPNSDQRIIRLLENGVKVRTYGKRLVLAARGGRVKVLLAPDVPSRPASMDLLDGRSFRSVAITGSKPKPKRVRVSFTVGPLPRHDEDGKQVEGPLMLGYAGCNWMSGEYRVRGGRVRWVGDVVSTAMMCFPYNDGWLSGMLRNGVRARIAGPVLTLTRGKNRIVLLRRR